MGRLAALLLVAALAATSIRAGSPAARLTRDQSSEVDALMSRWVQGNTPGAAVLVVQKGQVVHAKGYGLADIATREPITPTTVFDIASVSKPFTAMAILMLVDQGKLQYTDTLGKFFPEFIDPARQVTIRQLLSHTSGLADYTLTWGESRPLKDGTPRTATNVARFLAHQRPRFQPGQRWEYSNSNYVMLAQIVGKVSQQPFPQYVRDHIFEPLGMNDSFVYDRTHTGAHATGYGSRGATFVRAERNAQNDVYGDGQVNSTIADLAKWERAFSSERLVSAARLKEAFSRAQTDDGTPVTYGFGWGLGRYGGLNFVGHGGETDGFRSQITHFPQRGFTVVVLSNNDQFPAPHAIANKIASIYLAGEPDSSASSPLTATRLKEYDGAYDLYDRVLKISHDRDALWLTPPGQNRVKLEHASDEEFLVDGSNGASRIGFGRSAHGTVTCLSLLDQNGTMFWKK